MQGLFRFSGTESLYLIDPTGEINRLQLTNDSNRRHSLGHALISETVRELEDYSIIITPPIQSPDNKLVKWIEKHGK